MSKNNPVLIRGGGDLATGVALRLYRAGIKVVITELAEPLAVRRAVSFSEAVYKGQHTVEGVTGRLIEAAQLRGWRATGSDEIPVLIDPEASILSSASFPVVVDARLTKQPPAPLPVQVPLHIGLGPGFTAGQDCHAVIETRRSHTLGRVYWTGTTQPDSGEPEGNPRRVLRAPGSGVLVGIKKIGDHCDGGEVIASIVVDKEMSPSRGPRDHGDAPKHVYSPFRGVLRGLIRDGLHVDEGLKIGDVDARNDVSACFLVSDKSLAIGGAVLEAVLSQQGVRELLY